MKNTYVFRPEQHHLGIVRQKLKQGLRPVCPQCGTELVVALSAEEAMEKDCTRGVWCPRNKNHVEVSFNPGVRNDFWDQFD